MNGSIGTTERTWFSPKRCLSHEALSFVIPKARSAEEPAYIQLVGSGEGGVAAPVDPGRPPGITSESRNACF